MAPKNEGEACMMTFPTLKYFPIGGEAVAFSTTRLGGVSTGNYAEFNINPYCGDSTAHVQTNRVALAQALGIAPERIVMPHQVHGTRLLVVDAELINAAGEAESRLEGVDGLLTRERGLCIGVSTADCIPIILYDRRLHAAAAIHAGWRGTVKGIARLAVEAMTEAFGSRPSDLTAVLGPGISLAAFEVGDEVYEAFARAGFPMDRVARRCGKWHIDLPECNRWLLAEAMVAPEDILATDICTWQQAGTFFSARRLGQQSGRIFTGILLK